MDDPEKEIINDVSKGSNEGGKKGAAAALKIAAKGANSPRGESPSTAPKVSWL